MCLISHLMPYLMGWFYHVLFLGTETWLALLRTLILFDLNNIHPSLFFFFESINILQQGFKMD